ncbi:PDDEXK nuclease domain-containing protein [Sinomonas albida]|uniref:PDDEXK nuclease domain-containing protein n=1 Tax=Sinomonas albida TaxID=369942 RepID=UPI001457E507|nr:PDDEXK nuclease domain-containing protein [Sinomonas albida]
MSELIPTDDVPSDSDGLLAYVVDLVERGRRVAAVQVNAALTLTNWLVGRAISVHSLRDGRAEYGQRILATLSQELSARFGSGYDESNLNRMVTLSRQFPNYGQVAQLAQQVSWSHLKELLSLKSDEARAFYAREAATKHLSVRELRAAISRKAFERREIANSQIPEGSATPRDTFADPLILDALGLQDTFLERDLEAAILRDMQSFLLEVGHGFAFVAAQKRMTIDGDDFYLDLLFYSRPLRRLVAVELKIGKFDPRHEGQMKLYLKWLDRYERQDGEESPIGLILCTEVSREQVELLEMHRDGIVVAEYWTALPPKAELEAKLGGIVRDARERLARRGIDTYIPNDGAQGGGSM